MPTNNPRFSFMIQPELLASIEEYKEKQDFKSLSQAVVSLLSLGIFQQTNAMIEQKVFEPLSLKEMAIISRYRKLDDHGKQATEAILNIEAERCAVHTTDTDFSKLANLFTASNNELTESE